MMRRALDRHALQDGDAGFTLVEALVSMVVFVASMSVIASVVAAMTANMRQAHGVSLATDQTRLAFQRLDKQVRYANAISIPGAGAPGAGLTGFAWYVELHSNAPDHNPGATPTDADFSFKRCTQWRLRPDGHLQTRNWLTNPAGGPQGTLPNWTTVSTGVINDLSSEPPFTSLPTTYLRPHHEMVVDLRTRRSNRPVGRAHLKSTFYARNSMQMTPQVGVCARAGYRG